MATTNFLKIVLIPLGGSLLLNLFPGCPDLPSPEKRGSEPTFPEEPLNVRTWYWDQLSIPSYFWPEGTAFGKGLFIDVAYDTQGVAIVGDLLRFNINPKHPTPPLSAPSPFNYRSEIHTDPWPIEHPLGTEQWIGWRYTFGKNYKIDPTSPITIFQNHPGINGLSPQLEIEIAGKNDPPPAKGGEIQIVNAANNDRFVYPVVPKAGESLDIVVHVIYGVDTSGLLQIWLNDELYYNKKTSTVYEAFPWGGNNKWGIYHHTFNNDALEVQNSLDAGAGRFDLFMGPLRLLTRTPSDETYGSNAYHAVRPK